MSAFFWVEMLLHSSTVDSWKYDILMDKFTVIIAIK